ncbi:hypothetical protein PHYBOEH_004598 [Phytophthora boehmeriae]|uniref:RxLR effector protein n=1 Tax=Phytophthora boehmeriae TaxID=109152 RepID=A0A8T1WLF2_9STRA|nr:hypothetical protein PHYBOEH_004598 [Phytophthora boehmeriae]
MRLSNILLAITATTVFATANAISAVADSKTTAVASSDVVRSLETNVEPKRMLRSYKEDDEYDYLDSNDALDSDDALDSNDEERGPVNVQFNRSLFNKMLKNSKLADDTIAGYIGAGMTKVAAEKLFRVRNNKRFAPLVRKFEDAQKTALGKKVPQLPK